MPFGDGTGPRGMGPMTGRGAGYCAGFASPILGRRWFGFGRRRAYRYPYAYRPPVTHPGYGYPYRGRGHTVYGYPYVYP